MQVPSISRSEEKIALARESRPATAVGSEETSSDYHFIRLSNLQKAFTCCGIPLSVIEDRSQKRCFVCSLYISCTVCGKKSFITNPYCDGDLEVNSRSVLAARAVGNGRADLATFVGMPAPVAANHFSLKEREIALATKKEREASFENAVSELRSNAKARADDIIDIKVTCDATWQRRGHQSLYGIVVVASWDTGKVLDVELLSKFCFECSKKQHLDPTSPEFLDWWEAHSAFCNCNYKGTSGGMEVEGALRIWERSILKYKIRYTQMIADGDSATYSTIRDKAPYGKNHPVVNMNVLATFRKECIID